MSSPNLGPLEQLFHQEFLSMNFTTHQSRNKANKPLMIDEDWRTQFIDFIKEFKLPPHVDPKSAEAARIISVARVWSLSATTYTSTLLQASS